MKKYLLTAILAFTTLLHADYVLKYQMDTDVQTFMYHSDKSSKMISSSEGDRSEIYKIGKKSYVVRSDRGKKTVMDMDAMKKMSQSMGYDASAYQEQEQEADFKIKKTSKRVTVAGIRGEVWILSGEEDGEKFQTEIVVTKDRKVVKTVRAMSQLFSSLSGSSSEESFFEPKKGYVTIKADGMQLKSFAEKKIASSEYQLPKDAQKQKLPDFAKIQTAALDSCYTKVCCGKTAGKAQVLASSLKSSFRGYKLLGSGVCDALGISSMLGINSVEGALYQKGDDYIQVTLNMDDKEGGMLRSAKKNLDAGRSLGMVRDIKNYSDKKRVNGIQVIQGELLPMKQETLEYIINATTTLTISRLRKNNKGTSLMKVVSSGGGVNLKKLKSNLRGAKVSKVKPMNVEDVKVDEAMNLLKSFF